MININTFRTFAGDTETWRAEITVGNRVLMHAEATGPAGGDFTVSGRTRQEAIDAVTARFAEALDTALTTKAGGCDV